MQKIHSFPLVGLALGAALLPSSCKNQQEKEQKNTERPNIVFIMSDDHAYQAVSSYNPGLMQTPNIDRLAKEGVRFTNSFVTNSISAPSRAVLLTGKYSHQNGHVNNSTHFDGSQQTFPKLLQKAGYATAMIGKWHLKSEPQGFDYWRVLPGQGSYYNPDFIEMGEKIRDTGYVTDLITQYGIEWLKNRPTDKPFCLLIHHKAPHREWLPAKRHFKEYTQKHFEEPATLFDDYQGRGQAAKESEMNILEHMNWAGDSKIPPKVMQELGIEPTSEWDTKAYKGKVGRMTPEQRAAWDQAYKPLIEDFKKKYPEMNREDLMHWRYQRYMQDYLGCIAAVDEGVGKVLDYLDQNGLDENTLVVYTSDQGFYLGEHGWFDKRFMYEESLRMPLLMRFPKKIEAGTLCEKMVLNLDFAPTFLDWAGVEIPDDIQGKSLAPLLEGKQTDWREAIYYHYYEYPSVHMVKRHYGVRNHRYKLIHFYYDIDQWELYDLEKDPNELNNLYNNPEYEPVIKELKQKLKELQEKYKDTDYQAWMTYDVDTLPHLAQHAGLELKTPYAEKYDGGNPKALVDGIMRPVNTFWQSTQGWQGFENNLEALVKMHDNKNISQVEVRFLEKPPMWSFAPENIKIEISEDGKNFVELETKATEHTGKKTFVKTFSANATGQKARFVKVSAQNPLCPEWHSGAGEKAWLFCDEIVVK